ncbi:PRTRC system protein B [Candidatus Manganitrophus noduliformans]|nr:PRTRC system protein B [Candidatus Manganitrophus noduliformans]
MAQTLHLSAALLYYTGEDPLPAEAIHYWQIHPIEMSEKGIPLLREGRPVQMKDLESLCKATLPNLIQNVGWIDPALLAYGAGVEGPLVFFRPEVRRPIYFGRQTSLKSGMVLWPSLVMVAFCRKLYVFATKGRMRPTQSTSLLMAPFLNVDVHHEVCLGSSRLPNGCRPQNMEAWAEAFYASAFTHNNAPDHHFLKKGTMVELWEALLSGKLKRFPYHLLKPAGITLRQLLQRIGLDECKR